MSTPKLPSLDNVQFSGLDEDYPMWRTAVVTLLAALGWLFVVEPGAEDAPKKNGKPEAKPGVWYILFNSWPARMRHFFSRFNRDPAAAWKAMEVKFMNTSGDDKLSLQRELANLQMVSGKFDVYLDKLFYIFTRMDHLAAATANPQADDEERKEPPSLSDKDKKYHLLSGMPMDDASWSPLVMVIRASKDTFEEALDKLSKHYDLLRKQGKRKNEVVLAAKPTGRANSKKWKQLKGKNGKRAFKSKPKTKQRPTCSHCSGAHPSDNCWEKYPEQMPERIRKLRASESKSAEDDVAMISFMYLSSGAPSSVEDVVLLADSCSATHVFNDRRFFTDLREVPERTGVGVGGPFRFSSIGDVCVTINGRRFLLRDAAFVPTCPFNLLSVPRLWSGGVVSECSGEEWTFFLAGELLFKCSLNSDHSLPVVQNVATSRIEFPENFTSGVPSIVGAVTPPTVTFPVAAGAGPSLGGIDAAHRLLGHASQTVLQSLRRQGLLGGFSPSDRLSPCSDCVQATLARSPFPTDSYDLPIVERKVDPFNEIHLDLTGPITPTGVDGFRYVLLLIDKATRFLWVFMIARKNDAFAAFDK